MPPTSTTVLTCLFKVKIASTVIDLQWKTLKTNNKKIIINYLKLQSVNFASLSPSLFETCNCSYLLNYHLYEGCASTRLLSADESNILRRMCGCQSPHRWILYFGITWKYDLNNNFYRKMSSEQACNKSATFVLTN